MVAVEGPAEIPRYGSREREARREEPWRVAIAELAQRCRARRDTRSPAERIQPSLQICVLFFGSREPTKASRSEKEQRRDPDRQEQRYEPYHLVP